MARPLVVLVLVSTLRLFATPLEPAARLDPQVSIASSDQTSSGVVIFGTQGGGVGGVVPVAPAGVPPRDQPPRTGTSRLHGRVMAADTGQPLRRAVVRLSGAEIRESRSTTTAADGTYEFKDLPAGRYTISASKGSYVSLAYGQIRPSEAGRPVVLADHQALDRIDIRLPRGAIITGRVVDEFGEAVADASVMSMRQRYVQGRRRLMPTGRNSMTNDIGEFRLFGLEPGQYYLTATLRGGVGMMDRNDDRAGYAPTYYPGTADVTSAQRITVSVGQTLTDISIPLVPTQTAQLSGNVIDAEGRPASSGMVSVMARGLFAGMGFMGGSIRPDGTFTVSGVAPGEYVLRAMLPSGPNGLSEAATAIVAVNGQDVTGIQLIPQRPVTISGRIFADNAAARALNPSTIQIMATPANPDDAVPGLGVRPVAAKDDFTFEVKAMPGRFVLRTFAAGQDWSLKSVRDRGTDVTDTGFDLRPGENLADLEVELTSQRPEVSGLVTDGNGVRATNYTVVVFPQDRERGEYPMSRYFATARPDQEGRFRIRSLPPSDYYAVAVEYVEPGQWMDPDFLDSVRHAAVGFSLGPAETKTLDLRLSEPR